jgi:hypothetical protein
MEIMLLFQTLQEMFYLIELISLEIIGLVLLAIHFNSQPLEEVEMPALLMVALAA